MASIFQATGNKNSVEVLDTKPEKIEHKRKKLAIERKWHLLVLKAIIHNDNIIIMNFYTPSNTATSTKQLLKEMQRDLDENRITVRFTIICSENVRYKNRILYQTLHPDSKIDLIFKFR